MRSDAEIFTSLTNTRQHPISGACKSRRSKYRRRSSAASFGPRQGSFHLISQNCDAVPLRLREGSCFMKSNARPVDTPAPVGAPRLLMSGDDVREALGGISKPTLRRLELIGLLRPVRLTHSLRATKYYSPENVEEVARGQDCSDLDPADVKLPSRRTSPRKKQRHVEARAR